MIKLSVQAAPKSVTETELEPAPAPAVDTIISLSLCPLPGLQLRALSLKGTCPSFQVDLLVIRCSDVSLASQGQVWTLRAAGGCLFALAQNPRAPTLMPSHTLPLTKAQWT